MSLKIKKTNLKDYWSCPIYTDKEGVIYVDTNHNDTNPHIHTVTSSGEPFYPLKNYIIINKDDNC